MLIAPSTRRRRLGRSTRIRWNQAGEERHIARVTVGGPGRRFEPHSYHEKWSDEAWMTLAYPESARDLQTPTLGGNLAEVIGAGDRLHRYYVDADGNLEYELVFGTKPPSNGVEFHLDFADKLSFDYQPALNRGVQDGRWAHATETEAFSADGRLKASRPIDIVGSYAVYWHKTNNQYQTGKLCHIKRPKFYDARGDWRWGVLEIDRERKLLRITAPERWLARAVYPVTLDPSVGHTSLGASTDVTEDYSLSVGYTAGEAGDADPGTAYLGQYSTSGTVTNYLGIYVYDGVGGPFSEARISSAAISVTTTQGTFKSGAITWTSITAIEYFLSAWSDNTTTRTYYDATGETGWYNRVNTAAPPDPFPTAAPGDNGSFDNRVSEYVDFTASGAAAPSVPARLMLLGVGS